MDVYEEYHESLKEKNFDNNLEKDVSEEKETIEEMEVNEQWQF